MHVRQTGTVIAITDIRRIIVKSHQYTNRQINESSIKHIVVWNDLCADATWCAVFYDVD